MADEIEGRQKSTGYSRRRINLRKTKDRHESEFRSADNSTTEYNAEFETQWTKNVLSEYFRYIGHQGPILIMECIALLQGEDGELHLCGKRLRIRQGNYGNLARHKDLLHRHWIAPAVNEASSVMEDSMTYMPMSSADILSSALDHDNSIESNEVKMEFLELIPDLEAMVHACVKSEHDQDQVYSASENSQEQCNSNSTSVPERRSVRTNNRINSKQKRFDLDVLTMYADGLPLDFTCKNSFRNSIANLDSNIRVKSQQYYLRKLDFAIRNQVRPQFHRFSKATEVGCCHFSLDVWGTAARIDVLAVKLHAITKEWVHIERTIAVKHCMREQTIVNIGEEFQRCLETYDIPCEKIGVIITDDAVKMRKAFRLANILLEDEDETLEEEEDAVNSDGVDDSDDTDDDNEDLDFILDVVEDDSCEINVGKETVSLDWPVPHNVPSCVFELQLVIQDAILSDAVAMQELCKVYKVMSVFRRSTKWTTILRNKMASMSEMQNKLWNLANPHKTRWNSVLTGLQMLSDEMIHDAVQSTLLEAKLSSGSNSVKMNLAAHTLGSVAKLLELSYLLNGLGEATDYLKSGGVTAHKVMLIIIKAFKDLKETNVWYYHDLKKSLLEGLVKRFEPLLQSEEFVMATICDPRQKLRLFGGGVQFGEGLELRLVGRMKAESILTEHYNLLEGKLNETVGINGEGFGEEVNNHFKATKRKRDIIDEIDIIAPVDKGPPKPTQSEVKIYLDEACVSNEVDVLQYWKQSTIRFPILSKIAMRYLGIPTSSASLERDNFTRLYSRCCRPDRTVTKVMENRVLFSEHRRFKHMESSSSSMSMFSK